MKGSFTKAKEIYKYSFINMEMIMLETKYGFLSRKHNYALKVIIYIIIVLKWFINNLIF